MRQMPRRELGSQGFEVSALGLGCRGFSAFSGAAVEDEQGIAVIHHAFKNGVTFFDTSDSYGPFRNEKLRGLALKTLPRDKVQLATKFAISFEGGDVRNIKVRGNPEYVKKACNDSLERLGVDYIDLYYQHRVDTSVPIEVTVRALKELVEGGKIKYIGPSEAGADTIRCAHAVHPITALQIGWSLWTRDIEPEITPVCRELGIGIVPFSPLGRGFFSGKSMAGQFSEGDVQPVPGREFREEQGAVRASGSAGNATSALGANLLVGVRQGDDVVPIPGTNKILNLDENIDAPFVKLTPEQVKEVAAAVPEDEIAGHRTGQGWLIYMWSPVTTPPLSSYT